MKTCSAKQLLRILLRHGFSPTRQRGSHIIMKNNYGITVPVPLHGENRPIPIGTFLAIVKQSKLPRRFFEEK